MRVGQLSTPTLEPLLRQVPGIVNDWQAALFERDPDTAVQLRLSSMGTALPGSAPCSEVLAGLQRTQPEAWLAYVSV